jgi:hypothetical protein
MRALLRFLSVALTISLVSTSVNAQITGEGPKPGGPTACPTVTIEPARGWCPGWEIAQACTQTVFTVVLHNTTSCVIPFFRLAAMPHSQGMNFSVCAPGLGVSRAHCAADPIQISMDQKPLQPGEMVEIQVMADRTGDLEIFTLCKENFQQCSIPVHVPMFPSPYPSDPNQHPKEPDQPAPTQTVPGPTPTQGTEGQLMPQDPRPDSRTATPTGLKEGNSGPEIIGQ